MKKLLLSAALVAVSLLSIAQTQVPNGDFEDWSETDCSSEIPDGYTSFSDAMPICPTSTGVSKSTNKYSGTNALELTSLMFMGQYSGNVIALNADFDGRPTKLVGYTKFTKGDADTLGIFVALGDMEEEEPVGFGELTISATQSDYMKFEIPILYSSSTSEISTLVIFFGIGDENEGGSESTVALIDNLSFEYGPATSTVKYSAKSPINVFAANNNINFSENVSDVHVVDMVGANKLQEAASTKVLNTSSLNSGMYIVTYNYNGNYFSKKVVVE